MTWDCLAQRESDHISPHLPPLRGGGGGGPHLPRRGLGRPGGVQAARLPPPSVRSRREGRPGSPAGRIGNGAGAPPPQTRRSRGRCTRLRRQRQPPPPLPSSAGPLRLRGGEGARKMAVLAAAHAQQRAPGEARSSGRREIRCGATAALYASAFICGPRRAAQPGFCPPPLLPHHWLFSSSLLIKACCQFLYVCRVQTAAPHQRSFRGLRS